ncbi:MAG: DUF4097 domain-containing protein [Clostridiales bacterium]|jgi:hypothetical protein|nr:DUF4097 domain-containing protein [Clostridiales bacterium]
MPNEKLMILKMLEEGKISAKEAGRLLEAAGREDSGPSYHSYTAPPKQPASSGSYSSSASYAGNANNRPYDEGVSRPAAGLDSFAGDLSRKFDVFARDLEPKLQRFSETVVEKTADIADRISRSIEDSRRSASPSVPRPDGQEKRFELFVTPGYNELNIAGLNGDVLIHGYNGDKISASVFCKPRRLNAPLSLMRLGNKYFLNYDDDDFDKVAVDAYVPESMFNVISVNTINGLLDVSTLSAENMSLNNSNGQTKLQSLAADFLKTECNNGRLNIGIVKARNARVENFNGAIDVLDLDSSNLKLTSVNGGIVVNMSQYASFSDYLWDIESSNGKLTLNLPTYPELGYHVKAHASLGQIRVGLTNLNYLFNSSSLTEAKSINFDHCPKKVKLALETSNATLQIN